MKILVIEDDINKAKQMRDLLNAKFASAELIEKHSYQSGLKEVLAVLPEVVVLDMSLPTFDVTLSDQGGRMRPYAGREILRELARRRVHTKAVVVTQFETFFERDEKISLSELKDLMREEFPEHYYDTIYYAASESSWKDKLVAAVTAIHREKAS